MRLVALLSVVLLATLFVPAVYAYSFSNGQVTSSDGRITVPIPYVNQPATVYPDTYIKEIAYACGADTGVVCPSFVADWLKWLESMIVNLLIDVGNALIIVANVIIGTIVKFIGGLISVPVYLFDAMSLTTLGPVVDFLSFIPSNFAWLATATVWAIALTEWTLMTIVIVRLARAIIGSLSGISKEAEVGI